MATKERFDALEWEGCFELENTSSAGNDESRTGNTKKPTGTLLHHSNTQMKGFSMRDIIQLHLELHDFLMLNNLDQVVKVGHWKVSSTGGTRDLGESLDIYLVPVLTRRAK